MNTISLILTNEEIKKYKSTYKNFLISNNNSNVNFILKINNVRITFYFSNKVVFQGKDAEAVSFKYFNTKQEPEKIKSKKNLNNFDYFVGSDEVGVGDYFGGLVVCAVLVNKEQIDFLKKLGIDDSKNLTDKKMLEIYESIKDKITHMVCEFDSEQYNKFFDKYKNSHMSKTFLHHQALSTLINKEPNSFSVIDQYVNEDKFNDYLNRMNLSSINISEFTPKAESEYIFVAAASIIARIHFLKQIEKIEEKLDMQIPLGAWNSKIELTCKNIIDKYGFDKLKENVKQHFSNTEKLIKQ